ncbi:transcriptional regulatory protein AlgP-like [Spodoptera frugiperda]|uniref:Transcriptional regulatory protein AlgP-like n=1 Tax=Spodoptera frugiperda TaxID=7108 RepID=A0A9R0E854_SPOFR|nr:transcriptional regulatory protein AlgP-like [Spodoptera frugiperda]
MLKYQAVKGGTAWVDRIFPPHSWELYADKYNINKQTTKAERVGELSSPAVVLAEGPSGSGARGEALDSSGKSHTRAPSRKGSDSESDSSSVSGVSVILKRQTRSTFKRPRMEEGLGLSSSSNALEAPAPPKIPTAARGRGRGKAKRRAATARSKPAECPAAADSTLKSAAHTDSSVMEVSDGEGSKGARLSETLRQAVREGLRLVAGKKTQSARAAQLKLVEAEIMAAAFDVCRIPSAGKVHQELAEMRRELARLSVSNAALEAELRSTKAELAACRRSQLQPPAQPQAEPDMLGLLRREMAAFQQRYDVLESRLLRPPLAASSTYAAVAARPSSSSGQTGRGAQPPARTGAAPPARAPAPPPTQAPAVQTTNASAGRRKRRRGAAAQQAAPATGVPTPTARGRCQ